MATMMCHGCEALFDDDELFCPHCGAASIPQKTRTELQTMQEKVTEKQRRWSVRLGFVGAIVGIVASLVGFAATMDPAMLLAGVILFVPVFASIGGLIGLAIDIIRVRSGRR